MFAAFASNMHRETCFLYIFSCRDLFFLFYEGNNQEPYRYAEFARRKFSFQETGLVSLCKNNF